MSQPHPHGHGVAVVTVQEASALANVSAPTAAEAQAVSESQAVSDSLPALIVDVREPHEFTQVRVEGAVLMPLGHLGQLFAELPRDRKLLLMCRTGARSERATAFLASQGYDQAANVSGGIVAWYNAGLPVRTGPLEPGEGEF